MIEAIGDHYFSITGFPVFVGRVVTVLKPTDPPPHPHDLTEVEHTHNFNELVIVTKGQAMQCLEGVDMPITAGDVFLLQGSQHHYFHDRQDLEIFNVMYDLDQLNLPEQELMRMPGYCAMFLLEPAYRQQHRFASRLHLDRIQLAQVEMLARNMEHECHAREHGFEVMLRAQLLEIMAFLSRTYVQEESTESKALLRVGKLIGALENEFARDWSLQEMADAVHMSKSSLLTVFRKATGQAPFHYLLRLRIQRAMELLSNSEKTITEIAFFVGFNDSNNFSRQFRKICRCSPRQFRKETRLPSKSQFD
jgi:AraC-like DNA-binding protein/mannose-6-phosphate isomerase-like protein (cupin superfamily)